MAIALNRTRVAGWTGAAAGLSGAAAATVLVAVVHTLAPAVPFPPLRIAQALVRAAPGGFATFFIDRLGHWALRLAVVATAVAFLLSGAVLGLAIPALTARLRGRPHPAAALAFVPLWALGVALYPPDPQDVGRLAFAAVSLPIVAAAAFIASRIHARLVSAPAEETADMTRRTMLRAAWFGAAGLLLGFADLGKLLYRRPDPGLRRLAVAHLATPAPSLPSGPADAGFSSIRGLSPLVTPNADFYVVDEEIVNPDIDPATWRMSVGGLVGRPVQITYDELMRMPAVERYQTLECISNFVGGNLISNAKWVGIPLPAILDRAGVKAGAVEVAFQAAGGYSDSLSVEQAMDPSTLIAIGMNDHVLPRAHGFPARVLSVGTYGMKNPKWLTGIRVVNAPYQGFWEQRGWTKAAVVQTESRIDTPQFGDGVSPSGPVAIAGVAFAGDRGISKVQVSGDGGSSWRQAVLEPELSPYSWRRWRIPWSGLRAGRNDIVVRAYDGTGAVQTRSLRAPHPSGATGYDDVVVSGEGQ